MKAIKYFCAALLISCSGCSDFLEKEPLTVLSPETFWNTKEDLRMALNILYANMNTSYDSDNYSIDTYANNPNTVSSGTFTPSNEDKVWTKSYQMIRICNQFLENFEKAQVSDEIKNRYAGEARFFRAYYYYQLVCRFGDLPLVTHTLTMEDPDLYPERTDKKEVWNLIFEDLQFAADNIPVKSKMKSDLGRITQGAAYSFMARAALYAGTYYKFHVGTGFEDYLKMAIKAAKNVMDSNEYALYPDYRKLFLAEGCDSAEDILSFRYSEETGFNKRARLIIYDLDCEPTKYVADNFLCKDGLPVEKSKYTVNYLPSGEEFENRDPRMALTLWRPGDSYSDKPFKPSLDTQTRTGYMFKKYGIESAFQYDPAVMYVNNMLIRYPEVLLTYAEAIYELENQITDDDLDKTINVIRDRFIGHPDKLPHLTNAFVNEHGLNMRDEIRRERRAEFTGEGMRYNDIIRWKIAETELPRVVLGIKFDAEAYPNLKPGKDINLDANGFIIVQTAETRQFDVNKNYLFPLPLRELSLNEKLTQNPNWD